MTVKLGPMTFGEREELVFLGRSISEHRNYSEAIARKIDSEVRLIIGKAYDQAVKIMTDYREILDSMAEGLIHKETLDEAEVSALLGAAA